MNKASNIVEEFPQPCTGICFLCNLPKIKINNTLGVPICENCWGQNANDFKYYKVQRTIFFLKLTKFPKKYSWEMRMLKEIKKT